MILSLGSLASPTDSRFLFEETTKKIDEGSSVGIVHMDFSKASDQVPCGVLVWKVWWHGIWGELNKLASK